MGELRIAVCEHTEKPVVQEKIIANGIEEWLCLHGNTEQEDLELIKEIQNQ